MPSKRTRKAHAPSTEISTVALYYATDGLWADPPENGSVLDIMVYKYPTVRPDQCREVWLAIRGECCRNGSKGSRRRAHLGGFYSIQNARAYRKRTFVATVGKAVISPKTCPTCAVVLAASAIRPMSILH